MTTLDLDSIEIKRIDLSDGEPLAIIIKSDDFDEPLFEQIRQSLAEQFKDRFTNKVVLFGISPDDDIDFVTLKEVLEKLK